MNVIDAMLRYVRRDVPQPILRAAFVPDNLRMLGVASSVENEVMNKVIRPFVIPEIAEKGQYMEVDLTSASYEIDKIDQYNRIYYLSEQITGGRELIAAHIAVTPVAGQAYTLPPAGSYLDGTSSGVLLSASRLVDSNSALPRISSAEVDIMGPNAVAIKDPGMFVYATKIMAQFAMTEELNEIKPAFFPLFGKFATLAVKQYCYQSLMFDMDAGKLEHGVEFGAFKSNVENWADAGEMFMDMIPAITRALVHNDNTGDRYNYLSGGRFSV